MMRLGISGHRGLTPDTEAMIDAALREIIGRLPPGELVGVSCLADGADALFARAVLDHGARLEAVIPAARYRAGLPLEHHSCYDCLLGAASAVHRLAFDESTSEAHMAASEHMLGSVDELIAVWDGQPARGYGGTADVVDAARRRAIPVTVVWPAGSRRI